VTLVMWNLISFHLEIVLLLVQGRSTVCAKRSSEFVLDAPEEVTRLKRRLVSVHLEIVLILTQDRCTVHAKHSSKIILDALDGTPR
jgi:hypothetical protein